jgi:hypothetical protein
MLCGLRCRSQLDFYCVVPTQEHHSVSVLYRAHDSKAVQCPLIGFSFGRRLGKSLRMVPAGAAACETLEGWISKSIWVWAVSGLAGRYEKGCLCAMMPEVYWVGRAG